MSDDYLTPGEAKSRFLAAVQAGGDPTVLEAQLSGDTTLSNGLVSGLAFIAWIVALILLAISIPVVLLVWQAAL